MSTDYTEELNQLADNLDVGATTGEIVDEHSAIEIIDRDIVMTDKYVYAICCDSNSQLLTFRLKQCVEGIDLSTKVASIKFKNADGDYDRAAPYTINADGTYITLAWRIDKRVTYGEGEVTFQLEFFDNDETTPYSWQTKTQTFKVLPTLNVDSHLEPPSPTWVQEILADIDKLKKSGIGIEITKPDGTNGILEVNGERLVVYDDSVIRPIATTAWLYASDWDESGYQTITVEGVTANNTVMVSPNTADDSDSLGAYQLNKVICLYQGKNDLTFYRSNDKPNYNILVNILIYPEGGVRA